MIQLLQSLFTGAVGGAAVAFLAKTWIETRLAASIKHEYDKQLEQYKKELDKRQKVELLAELFAEWIATPPGTPPSPDQRLRLNKLSFAASLWLPPDLVVEVGKTLQLSPDGKSLFDVLLLARKEIAGDESVKAGNITFWGANLELKGQPIIQK